MVITENEEAKVIYRHIAALARSAYEDLGDGWLLITEYYGE